VRRHNAAADAGNHTFWVALNVRARSKSLYSCHSFHIQLRPGLYVEQEWADLTHREWVEMMMLRPTPAPDHRPTATAAAIKTATAATPPLRDGRHVRPVPAKVDWTSADTCKQPSGCVTSVKNQGYCGACWEFSAVGAIESAFAIAKGTLVNASVQQIIDCQAGANACAGGDTQDVWSYTPLQTAGLRPGRTTQEASR
jgi:hypothetical protein